MTDFPFSLTDIIRGADKAVDLGIRVNKMYQDHVHNKEREEIKKDLKLIKKLVVEIDKVYSKIDAIFQVLGTEKKIKKYFEENKEDLIKSFSRTRSQGNKLAKAVDKLEYFHDFPELRRKLELKTMAEDRDAVLRAKEDQKELEKYDEFKERFYYAKDTTGEALDALIENIKTNFSQ